MDIFIDLVSGFFTALGPFILLLGVLIFVHEMGHFLTALYFGVRVETFSLGFGKKLYSFKRGDTTYCISVIPLGGYVKMYGDNPNADIPPEEQRYSFLHQPVWPRLCIVAAGPLVNFVFAIFVFMAISMIGEPVPGPQLGDIAPKTAAYQAGFRSGDVVQSITKSGKKQIIDDWLQATEIIESNANKNLQFEVKRNHQSIPITIEPKSVPNDSIISFKDNVGKIDGLTIYSEATVVGLPSPDSPLVKAGIPNLALIHSINDVPVEFRRDLGPTLKKALLAGDLIVTYSDFANESQEKVTTRLDISDVKGQINASSSVEETLSALGVLPTETFLMNVKKGGPAFEGGLRTGDQILQVNEQKISTWDEVLQAVKGFDGSSEKIDFLILRMGELKEFSILPEMTSVMSPTGQEDKRYMVGIAPAVVNVAGAVTHRQTLNPLKAIYLGLERTIKWTGLTLVSFKKLFFNEVSLKNVSGIITIGRVASQSFQDGITSFLKMMALISINLFLLNLLPIPILDGGHLVFYTIEGLRGKPVSMKKMEIAQSVGALLLLSLMLFSFYNDIHNIYASLGW